MRLCVTRVADDPTAAVYLSSKWISLSADGEGVEMRLSELDRGFFVGDVNNDANLRWNGSEATAGGSFGEIIF